MSKRTFLTIVPAVLLWFCANSFGEPILEQNLIPGLFSNNCYPDLGCFYTGPPFFQPPFRVVSLPPWSPDKIGTRFLLFTPNQKSDAYVLEPTQESLRGSPFDESLQTEILIFGYLSRLTGTDEFSVMKDTFLGKGNYNIIIVDWSKSNQGDYFQACANARMVGAQIGQLVRFLQNERKITPQSLHLVGASLGAQVAGYAGQVIPNLGRITGLDAASPLFEGTDPEVHLDHTDAQFVDGIHTTTGRIIVDGLGFVSPYGDIDFYPSGGNNQPLCVDQLGGLLGYLKYFACNHIASSIYFIASINLENCTFIGTQCHSYQEYLSGACDSNLKAVMGFRAQPIPGLKPGKKFYLRTMAQPPYCISSSN